VEGSGGVGDSRSGLGKCKGGNHTVNMSAKSVITGLLHYNLKPIMVRTFQKCSERLQKISVLL